MQAIQVEPASYRDPSGRIYTQGARIFRTVMPTAAADYLFVRDSGALKPLIEEGSVIPARVVQPDVLGSQAAGATYVLEHPRLQFISYPYEWPFAALKAAAILHLDIHLRVLDHGVTLSDATAYNIQFQGPNPIFIDTLSFRRYRDGEYWIGHRQFCEQFLNPLLLRSAVGVPYNAWYRGSLEGIPTHELARLIPLRRKLSKNIFMHVVMQAAFQGSATSKKTASIAIKRRFPLMAFQNMLQGLRRWIEKLEPLDTGKTVWSDYAEINTYSSEETQKKRKFVSEFIASVMPEVVWDIGCNTGDFSKLALENGARRIIGFDFDQGALDRAFMRARQQDLNILPLFLDAANPSPNQGWAESERKGLMQRAGADAILALAVVHHLAISRNIPLSSLLDWLTAIARTGVVEFIPKSDPMVQALLQLRDDVFEDYTEESFVHHLRSRARVIRAETVSDSGRKLYWFERY